MIVVYSSYIVIYSFCWCLHADDLLSFCLFAPCVISGILVTLHQGAFLEYLVCSTALMASLWSTRVLLEYYVNVTQTVRDISPLMLMHQDPVLVYAESTKYTYVLNEHENESQFGPWAIPPINIKCYSYLISLVDLHSISWVIMLTSSSRINYVLNENEDEC